MKRTSLKVRLAHTHPLTRYPMWRARATATKIREIPTNFPAWMRYSLTMFFFLLLAAAAIGKRYGVELDHFGSFWVLYTLKDPSLVSNEIFSMKMLIGRDLK
jgi:hypothetical protein